jgi:uncharacterized protein (DUF362 family)
VAPSKPEADQARRPGGRVAIVEDAGLSPAARLEAALDRAGFWGEMGAPRGGGRALVLLDLSHFESAAPVVVPVDLVEHLVELLVAHGWSQVALASSADSSSTWAENRGVAVLADLLGYRYSTAQGVPYDILDLGEEVVDGGFPPGSALAGGGLARAWLESDLRVVLAKCRTDQRDRFALCADTLLLALPLADKDHFYRSCIDPAAALALLVERAPPHFAIVDACGSAHGSGGRQAPAAIATSAVLAGADLLAVDCAAAVKMGADPFDSALLAGLCSRLGRPRVGDVSGDLRPFPGFVLPDLALVAATRQRDGAPGVGRLLAPWLQRSDVALFPFKHPLDAQINPRLVRAFADVDESPSARAGLLALCQWLVALARAVDAYRTNSDKDAVVRRVAPISPETIACGVEEYRAMERELLDLAAWLEAQGEQRRSLRWRTLERAVVFEYVREFPVAFDEFARRVEIGRTIQLMADYLGGTLLPVERDEAGRPVRQVERNLYLPQPNYLAYWDAQPIDVSKIESVHYEAGRHRMFWKTIKSENGSATFDDGIVTFEGLEGGAATRVTFFGRQLFTLPPLLALANLEQVPELRAPLVDHAYQSFFFRTCANFDALLEGRDIAVGRAVDGPGARGGGPPRPVETLGEVVRRLAEVAGPLIDGFLRPRAGPAPAPDGARARAAVDAQGFTHVSAPAPGTAEPAASPLGSWLVEFWLGYAEAVRRDLEGVAGGGTAGAAREERTP